MPQAVKGMYRGDQAAPRPGRKTRQRLRPIGNVLRATLGVVALAAALSPVFVAAGPAAVPVGSGAALAWIEAGAQPCAELCDARWALDRMRAVMPQNVHAEFARRINRGSPMTDHQVATGDVIVAVSYASAGIPLVDLTRRVAQFPAGVEFPAHGHAIAHDGRSYRFVRVASWENWALIVDDPNPTAFLAGGPHAGAIGLQIPGGRGGIAGGAGGGGAGAGGGDVPLAPGPLPPDLLRRPVVPTPIPLPGGLALLAAALIVLGAPRLGRAAVRR